MLCACHLDISRGTRRRLQTQAESQGEKVLTEESIRKEGEGLAHLVSFCWGAHLVQLRIEIHCCRCRTTERNACECEGHLHGHG